MKFVRFRENNTNKVEMKGVLSDNTIKRVYGSFFQAYSVGATYRYNDVILLAPVLSRNIVCIDVDTGCVSAKLPSSVAANGATIQTYNSNLSCTPRVAFIVHSRNRSRLTGAITLFGFALMLDISGNFDGYSVLSEYITDDISVLARLGAAETIAKLADRITFNTGDIIAVKATACFECKQGRVSFEYEGANVEALLV
ncbi:hypothetical protein RsTz2092_00910 [Deferribacterales bacterium RsTz2092]